MRIKLCPKCGKEMKYDFICREDTVRDVFTCECGFNIIGTQLDLNRLDLIELRKEARPKQKTRDNAGW